MLRYMLIRLVSCVFVIIFASILIFSILYFVPGDPVQIILGDSATLEMKANLREELGLNGSYLKRLGNFLYNTFIRFDLGKSYTYAQPFVNELLKRLPRTLLLGVSCVLISVLFSVPMGIIAGLHNGKWQDSVCMFISMVGVSLPNFWFAMMLIILFSMRLKLLPSFGIGGIEYYILPVIAGSFQSVGTLARQTRSAMLGVKRSDFVTTARAKGIPERRVILKHMLPNALIPVITVIGGQFSRVIAGTVIIEQVFSIPGIGLYMLAGIDSRDYPVVQGVVIYLAIMISIISMLTDIVYAMVDPRIKAQYSGKVGGRS